MGEGVIDIESGKPEIILFYNETKGGVDTIDQLASTYTIRRRTRRWPMTVFGNLVDLAGLSKLLSFVSIFDNNILHILLGINGYVLYCSINTEWNRNASHRRRLFLQDLGIELISRCHQPIVTPVTPIAENAFNGKIIRGRCKNCPRSHDRKVKSRCVGCEEFICQTHTYCYYCRPG